MENKLPAVCTPFPYTTAEHMALDRQLLHTLIGICAGASQTGLLLSSAASSSKGTGNKCCRPKPGKPRRLVNLK